MGLFRHVWIYTYGMSLSDLSDELAQVRTKKKEFLAQIDRIVPWGEFATKSIVVHPRAGTTPIDPEHRSSAESVKNLPYGPKWNMSLLL